MPSLFFGENTLFSRVLQRETGSHSTAASGSQSVSNRDFPQIAGRWALSIDQLHKSPPQLQKAP
jgi:hypothetical protein